MGEPWADRNVLCTKGIGLFCDRLLLAALPCQIHPSPLKRSMSLIPTGQQVPSEWMNVDEMGARPAFISSGEHAPLSPQSSVASSGSEQTEEQPGSRNTFQEDGSGMKGTTGAGGGGRITGAGKAHCPVLPRLRNSSPGI